MASTHDLEKQLVHILNEVAKAEHIENYKINPSTSEENTGDGFVSKLYIGDILNKVTAETISVVIKKAPTPIGGFNFEKIFKNEDKFYNLIYPTLNNLQKENGVSEPFNNLPKYFCGGLEPDNQYIAMENLKPQGYVMYDKKKCWDREHLELIFKTYGKFHALSYVLRGSNKEKYNIITENMYDLSGDMEKAIDKQMTSAISAAVNALNSDTDKHIYDELEYLKTSVLLNFKKAKNYTGVYRCVIHGDCWSNNMLFKYSESGKLLDVKLIDFQLSNDQTPIHDLSYFFYAGAGKNDLDDLDNYLQIYHNSFTKFAKELGANASEIFSLETLQDEWKESALYGIILGVYLWQLKLTPKEDYLHILNRTGTQEKRSMEETMKLWTVLLDKVHKTDLYIERTTDILKHAVKYGVVNKEKIIRKNE